MLRNIESLLDINCTADAKYFGEHAAELLLARPQPYILHTNLSEPETLFYKALNEYVRDGVKARVSAVDEYFAGAHPLSTNHGTPVAREHTYHSSQAHDLLIARLHVEMSMNLLTHRICLGIFYSMASRAAKEMEELGHLTAEDVANINKHLSSSCSELTSNPYSTSNNVLLETTGDLRKYTNELIRRREFTSVPTIESMINKPVFSDNAKDFLTNYLTQLAPMFRNYDKARINFETHRILKRASEGTFVHETPVFNTDEEVTAFKQIAPHAFNGLIINLKEQLLPYETIQEAINKLADRVYEFDTPLIARQKRLEEEIKQQQKNLATTLELQRQEARERAQREHDAFMAVPHPYQLENGARSLFSQLISYSLNTTPNALKTGILVQSILRLTTVLDLRDPGVKELGTLLLSTANIKAAAQAYSVDKIIKEINAPFNLELKDRAELLSALYTTSAERRKAIDEILSDPEDIIFLATHTRKVDRCKNYAATVIENARSIHVLREHLDQLNQRYTDDEVAAFPDDVAIINFLYERGKLEQQIAQKETETAEAHQKLASEIRIALTGQNVNKIKEAPTFLSNTVWNEALVPEHWRRAMKNEFYAEPGSSPEMANIRSYDFPSKYIAVRLDGTGKPNIHQATEKLRTECTQHRANNVLLEELGTLGFDLISRNGVSWFKHKNFKIEIALSQIETTRSTQLVKAREQLERCFQQQTLLESLEQNGMSVTVPSQAGPITLHHQSLGTLELAPDGLFSDDDFTQAEACLTWLIQSSQPPEAPCTAPHVTPEKRTPPSEPHKSEPYIWKPSSNEIALLFDANTLRSLSSPRGHKQRTWLDLPRATARLPKLKVMIPSIVADLEILRRIPIFDNQGNVIGFEKIDTRFETEIQPLEKFFSTASRARILPDGSFLITPGQNSKIFIVDTPQDIATVYASIRAIMNGPEHQRIHRFETEIDGHDNGERAINRVLAALPEGVSACIISDDLRYLTRTAPLVTAQGMPVAHASTVRYLDAEFRARSKQQHFIKDHSLLVTLQNELGLSEPSDLNTHEVLSVRSVSNSIKKHWISFYGKERSLPPYSADGVCYLSEAPQQAPVNTIYKAIEHGIHQLVQEYKQKAAAHEQNDQSHSTREQIRSENANTLPNKPMDARLFSAGAAIQSPQSPA